MMWENVLLYEMPETDALRQALAEVFGILPAQVGVVRSSFASTGSATVRAVVSPVPGDFQCVIDISVDEPLGAVDRIHGTKRLCRLLRARGFVGDDSVNTATGFLIDEAGVAREAKLDIEAEDLGEYRLLT